MKNKIITALLASIALTLSCSIIPCHAEGEDDSVTEPLTDAVEVSQPTEQEEIDWEALKDAYTEEFFAENEAIEKASENNKNNIDYYGDNYYDTDGNASLIDTQIYDVIYSDDSLLFTAVTTKDGHVFYILINYADEDGEDNVYFLNKVDDYDLYSLLYADDDDDNSTANQIAQYEQQTTAANSEKSDSKATTTATEESVNSNQSSGNLMKLIICGAAVLLLGIGAFVVPKLLDKKKNNRVVIEDDDLDEISEDDV